MPSPLEILSDPNYINANEATKHAIFEKRVATSPEYKTANAATQAEIRRRFGVAMKEKPRQKGTGLGPLDFALNALNEAGIGVVEGATNLGALITDPLVGLVYGQDVKNKMQAQRRRGFETASRALSSQPMSVYREVGKTVAPAGAVSRAAGLAVPLAQRVPVAGETLARIAQATSSGGLGAGRTPAETARLSLGKRGAQLAQRMTGGAIAGGATAGLMGQDVTEGAMFGAGLPVVASLIRRIGGRLGDIGSVPKNQAAQMIRDALGENEEAARAAFLQLSPDDQRLARQVLVEAGVEPRVFMGMGADVERLRPDQVAATLGAQEQARTARLAQVAGGRTATERRAAAEEARRGVSEATGPLREGTFGTIKQTNQIVTDAEALAAAARQRAAEESGRARRFTLGAERGETALGQMDDLGDPFAAEAINRQRGRVGALTQRGEQAAQQAIGLRQTAQDMDNIVAELAAQGREPLLAAPLSNALRQQANAEGVRTSSARRALLKLASQIDTAADQNGMLNPYDLYTLRKEASDIIEKYVASSVQPSTGSKKRAAGLVINFKNMVDEALGPDFKDYLAQHRTGMEAVNRQELASTATQLAREPGAKNFIELMAGERPDIVENVLGRGTKNYDIVAAFEADPAAYMALRQSAKELETLNKMTELGREGSAAASELMGRGRPVLSRALTRVGLAPFPKARIGTEASEVAMAEYLRPRIRSELSDAFMSGPNMLALMNRYPASLRLSEGVSALPPTVRNVMAQSTTQPFYAEFPEIDPETGQVLVGIGEVDGQRYPMYGPRPR